MFTALAYSSRATYKWDCQSCYGHHDQAQLRLHHLNMYNPLASPLLISIAFYHFIVGLVLARFTRSH
jgi:hypothetical protein